MHRSRPDFYICGGRYDGNTILYASSPLNFVEFEVEVEGGDYDYYHGAMYQTDPIRRYKLNAESYNVTKIIASGYPEAFDLLFRQWSPRQAESIGIEGGKMLNG